MSSTRFAAVRGMNDLLPDDAPLWELLEQRAIDCLRSYGYRQVRTPLVEATGLFARGIGAVTDIVEREMYSFEDRLNGDPLTLRPEGTAGVVRAALEHHLLYDGPRRLWYCGPMFRHERPQRGRYRQFHQIGAEALGFAGPDMDAEQILMLNRLWRTLDLGPVRLELNCLGNAEERVLHRTALVSHFERHETSLDADARRRLHSNPLRILDTKNPAMQSLVNDAPRLLDFLGDASLAHFEGLKSLLDSSGVGYLVNPRLVRGLDYYNLTVFEWVTDRLGSQGTICGGGRYDPLVELLGGKAAPSCGFAMGVERLVELMREGGATGDLQQCDVYVLHQGANTYSYAVALAEQLRDVGLDVILHCGDASLKAQMRRADASGAEFAVIAGVKEMEQRVAAVKAMRDNGPEAPFSTQQDVPGSDLPERLVASLALLSERQFPETPNTI